MHLEISMAAEPLFEVGPFVITNSMLTTWLVMAFLVVLSIAATSRLSLVPHSRLQCLMELIVEFLLNLAENTAGKRVGRRIFPLIATLFIFILVANWAGILPGFGTITFENSHGHRVPLFRAATADMNTTVAMALIAITVVQFVGVTVNGVRGYLKELSTPLLLTPLHVIAEISHIISLSARLFGNVFGGEVLLVVMYALVPYVIPFVFLGLEMFFGFIQALIFSVLTAVYIALAAAGHGGGHDEAVAEAHA